MLKYKDIYERFRTVSVDIYRTLIKFMTLVQKRVFVQYLLIFIDKKYKLDLVNKSFRTVSVDIYQNTSVPSSKQQEVFVQYLLIFIDW